MKNINKGQIISGAILLGFDWIDEDSIKILSDSFIKDNPEYNYINFIPKEYFKYLYYQGNKYFLQNKVRKSSSATETEADLYDLAGIDVTSFYERLNTEAFILLKIWKKGGIYPYDNEDLLFSKFEQTILTKLKARKALTVEQVKNNSVHEKAIIVSDRGRIELFKYMNKDKLERFIQELEERKINSGALDDYLASQCILVSSIILDNVDEVLSIQNLEKFCNDNGIDFFNSGNSKVEFVPLNLSKDGNNDKDKVSKLFTIYDDGHSVCVCHPNHIFSGDRVVGNEISDITSINWDAVDSSKMIKKGDYKEFIMPQKAWKYTIQRLQHMIEKNKGVALNKATGHLAVVEKYPFNYEDNFLVRGIIKADTQALYVAFNPEYEEAIPTSTFEKGLRFSGRETPKIYLKSRKGSKN